MEIEKFEKKYIDVTIGENEGMKERGKGPAYLCGWLLPSSVTAFACTPASAPSPPHL
jgi:hypothetical protein